MFKSNLFENIFSLFTIKGLEYILAFITFPYLTRVLQVERFGAIVLAQGIIQYFVLFTDYGFNLTGPREIARNDGKETLAATFSAILFAKLILLLLAVALFAIGSAATSLCFNVDYKLYAVLFLMVIGNVIFPVWFFQGIQQMRYITFANMIARFVSVLGIFLLVKSPVDYLLAALFQASVPLVAGICSWLIIAKKYPKLLCLASFDNVKQQLKDSWQIFASTIAINLYTASNIVFLGMLTNNVLVGYFSGAKKIIDNITALFSPISQAVYPHICKLVDESEARALQFIKKVLIVMGVGNFCLSLVLMFFAELIVRILLGSGYEDSIVMLRIMAFLPFIIALSNVFGIQTMLPFGMQSTFSKIIMCAAVLNTVIVLPAIYFYQGIGVCCSIVVTEVFVTCSMWFVLAKKGIIKGE